MLQGGSAVVFELWVGSRGRAQRCDRLGTASDNSLSKCTSWIRYHSCWIIDRRHRGFIISLLSIRDRLKTSESSPILVLSTWCHGPIGLGVERRFRGSEAVVSSGLQPHRKEAAILILKIHGDKIMEGKIIGNHFPANEYDFTPHDFVARSWPVMRGLDPCGWASPLPK